MAKITKLPSGNWRTLVYMGKDENGKDYSVSVTAPTKDEVLVRVGELKKQKAAHKSKTNTVQYAVEKYIKLATPVLAPGTIARYKEMSEYAFQDIMDLRLSELTQEICQVAINNECKRPNAQTKKPLSAKTIHNEWALISSSIKAEGYHFDVKLPKIPQKVQTLPLPERIFNAVKGTTIELPVLLAMWCGLRMSELRGLDMSSIHDDEFFIDKVVLEVDSAPILTHLTKTDSSARKVKIPPYIMELIKNTDAYQNPPENGEFKPFVPQSHSGIYKPYKRRMRAAGIDISFHDLRHEFASVRLTILRQSIRTVQTAGGWKDEKCLLKLYSQTFTEEQSKANEENDNYYSAIVNSHNNSHERA